MSRERSTKARRRSPGKAVFAPTPSSSTLVPSAKDVDTTTSTTHPVSLATTVREALPLADVRVLFLDNFENVRSQAHRDELTRDIAQLMKSCADRGELKVVVAGIPAESERLLLLDEATSRRTAEIEVPRMRDEELDEILRKGRLGSDWSSTPIAAPRSCGIQTVSRTTRTCSRSARAEPQWRRVRRV